MQMDPAALGRIIAAFDTDRGGTIGVNEFVAMHKFLTHMRDTFYYFDQDRSGFLDLGELYNALTRSGYQISTQVLAAARSGLFCVCCATARCVVLLSSYHVVPLAPEHQQRSNLSCSVFLCVLSEVRHAARWTGVVVAVPGHVCLVGQVRLASPCACHSLLSSLTTHRQHASALGLLRPV